MFLESDIFHVACRSMPADITTVSGEYSNTTTNIFIEEGIDGNDAISWLKSLINQHIYLLDGQDVSCTPCCIDFASLVIRCLLSGCHCTLSTMFEVPDKHIFNYFL